MATSESELGTRARTYEHIPLGVVQIDAHRVITYANKAMRELAGTDHLVGMDAMSLVGDEVGRERLEGELRKRFEDVEGSQYEIDFVRPLDGRRVPVAVSAAPEFDDAGNAIGSLGFIRDLRLERANQAVHDAIQRETTANDLLRSLSSILRELISYDCFRVTVVSRNRKHLMGLYEFPELVLHQTRTKWWPMPPVAQEFLAGQEVHNLDVEEWFKKPGAKKLADEDEETRKWLEQGFKHLLVCPVLREGQVVAFLVLETRRPDPYTCSAIQLVEQLPVAEAVLTALQILKRRELEFAIDLIRNMGEAAGNIGKVAEVLVVQLESHYEWEHVSIFQVDEDTNRLRLLAQGGTGSMRLQENYSQPLNAGLLGRAKTSGRVVNVGDVRSLPDGEYVVGILGTTSEMCLPIPGKKLRWILNVEASKENAFANEEQEAVEFLVREAGFILERAALLELKTAILTSIKDAVVQTNSAGVISEANQAAADLFGMNPPALAGLNFAQFVADPDMQARVRTAADSPRTEVELRREDGKTFPALLSTSRLPVDLGGRVFVASDLTFQKKVEQTELLKEVFWQVALETRTPLALVSTWLRRALTQPDDGIELLEKSLRQLKKMDVTLERVMRVAGAIEASKTECAPVDLVDLVERLLDQLPGGDTQNVARHLDEDLPFVLADRRDLEFCVGNIFNVLQRSGAKEDEVVVEATRREASVVLALRSVPRNSSSNAGQRVALHTDTIPLQEQIAVGESIVGATLQRMGALLEPGGSTQTGYAIRLPVAQ